MQTQFALGDSDAAPVVTSTRLRWASSLVAVFAMTLGACSDDGRGSGTDDPRLSEWQSKTKGHQVTYTATFSCGICDIGGVWQVTERDGDIRSAEFREDREMRADASPLTLTEALRMARTANGPVVVLSSSSSAIDFTVDPDPSAIDDEFGYSVVDVVIDG